MESSQSIYKKVESVVFYLRRSPREAFVLSISVAIILLVVWVNDKNKLPPLFEQYQDIFDLYKSPLAILLLIVALVLLVWVVYRLYKVAQPSRKPDSKLSSSIKGLLPFDASDGELFSKLERQQDLNKIYHYIKDPTKQIIALMGESGAGKTSLLRAGLRHILDSEKKTYIYCEAFPSKPEESLLKAINKELNKHYESLNEMVSKHESPVVIVLDQFEQLSIEHHASIFNFLTSVVEQIPPHNITWIIAFRREYDPEWRDYELSLDNLPSIPMLSLQLFSGAQAKDILAILSNEAGLTLDQDLVNSFIESMPNNKKVSPVDISIGLSMLSELARKTDKQRLSLKDYTFAGGSEDLFVSFIESQFERFSKDEKEAALKILLGLRNKNGYTRISEGKNFQDLLNIAGLPEKNLKHIINHLTNPHVRLLEALPSQHYRLPHESIIPALQKSTGVMLAETEQAKLKLNTAYEAWKKSEQKNASYLLKGKELKAVLKYWPQIKSGEESKSLFIKISKNRKKTLSFICLCIASAVVYATYYGWVLFLDNQYRNALHNWGVPGDIYDYQTQLTKLVLYDEDILDLKWLKKSPNLKELTVSGRSIRSLKGLENLPALTTLSLPTVSLKSLQGLGNLPALTTLDLSEARLKSLQGLGNLPALTTLDLSGAQLKSLQGLGNLPALTTLDLSGAQLKSLQGLENLPALTTLDLSGAQLKSLQGLEKLTTLTALDLSMTRVGENQARTPSFLPDTRLKNLQGLANLSVLVALDLSGAMLKNLQGLNLPALTTLNLSKVRLRSLQGLGKLPALTTLDLSETQLNRLRGLEKLPELTTLDLSMSQLKSLQGLENLPALTTLNLSGTRLKSLQGLEKLPTLITLDLSWAYLEKIPRSTDSDRSITQVRKRQARKPQWIRLKNLQGLANLSELVTLNLSGSMLESLQDLEKLSGLTTLNLSSFPIGNPQSLGNLQGLSKLPSLTTLSLSSTRLENLQDLKKLSSLTTLDLSRAELVTTKGLESLLKLKTLDLSGARLATLKGLDKLPVLKTLNISRIKLSTLKGLKTKLRLTTLDLSDNLLESLQGVENLPALITLDLSKNPLVTLKGLEKSDKLMTLKLFNMPLQKLQGLPISVKELSLGDDYRDYDPENRRKRRVR